MNKLRKILYPLSILYGEVTSARNKLFDKGILKSTSFDIPVIVVGNLSVGGTGKTPMIEYLIRLLQDEYKIAVLSRGYKRTTKGFIVADKNATAAQIGDEPLQYFKKFKNITVAVDADRVNGITQLKEKYQPDVVLLDDAFQHRKVEAGFNILLTPYNNLYVDDTMLPAGDLREKVAGASRAQVIVVTKCPDSLSKEEQFKTADKLQPDLYQTVFFSKIAYENEVKNTSNSILLDDLKDYELILVTGIAKTAPLTHFLENKKINFKHLKFADHHNFSEKELAAIKKEYQNLTSDKKLILTTEKDYVRTFSEQDTDVYYLPITTEFLEHQDSFNQKILKFVESFSSNNK